MSDTTALVELSRKDLAGSKLFQHVNTPEKAGVIIAQAKALNLDPVFVASHTTFIGGKPAMDGNLLAVLLKRSERYRYVIEEKSDKQARITFLEKIDGKWEKLGTETFSMAMAQRAGLTSNATYKKYPEQMLFWRCLMAGARTMCPDITAGGFCHLIEELAPSAEYGEDGSLRKPLLAAKESPPGENRDIADAEVIPSIDELKALAEKCELSEHDICENWWKSEFHELSDDERQKVKESLTQRLESTK